MKMKWLGAMVLVGMLATPCFGETIYLSTGESVRGRIIRVDDQTISVESDKGYGIIQIAKSDVTLIEYDQKKRDPSRTLGFGYFHRSVPPSITPGATEYGVDALSLKYWLSSTDSMELQWGYYSAQNDGKALLEIFSLDVRYAYVFQRRANLDLYYGASAGYLSVKDQTGGANVDDTGTRVRVFIGAEAFFVSLPNLGVSAEIGFGSQTVGKQTVTNLSTTTFPTFGVRYYF
jgi:hypothetical protein